LEAVEIKTKDGVTICTPKDMKLLTPYVLFEQSNWFDPEINFLRDYLEQGMNVLDVGAGFGVYSLLAAKKVEQSGRVICFEPEFQSRYFLELGKKTNGFDHVEINRDAISGSLGTVGWKTGQSPELSSIDIDSQDLTSANTIDSWWESANNPKIDVLKIDTNGFETSAIKGASGFLSVQSPVLIVSVENSTAESLLKVLNGHGYELFEYIPGTGVLTSYEVGANSSLHNIIAMKSDRKEEMETKGWFLNEKNEVEKPDSDLWKEYLTTLPSTSSMMFGWEFAADEEEHENYFTALNYIIAAEQIGDETGLKNKKTGLLIEAAHRLIDIYSSGITNTSVTFTLARVFNALGKLDQTRQILQKLIDDTTFGQRNVDASLPFLLPIPSHDQTPVRTDFAKWLMVRTIESWILQKYDSTFWLQGQELQLLDVLNGNPELSQQMENVIKVRSISEDWDGISEKPKSLLFITSDFPPYDEGRVGHSIRAYTLANFFAENGYKVYLLILAKMVADREAPFMHENIQIINPVFHEQKSAKGDLTVEEFCVDFMKYHKVPTLLTSSPPLTSHLMALTIKKELKDSIYWISDFRDFIHIHPLTRSKTQEGFQEQKEYETEVMQLADAVITVSTGMVKIARDLHLELGKDFRESKVEIVENGYIEQEPVAPQKEVVEFINQSKKEGRIVLYYAGTGSVIGLHKFDGVYKDLTFIFDVFQNNPEIAKKYALVIQGKVQVNLDYLKKLKTSLSFRFFDPVPNALMQANLGYADVGLSVNSDEIATPYIMGGKLYDYANAGLALLLIYPDNPYSLKEFSSKHGDKAYFGNVFDPESVKDVLSQIIMEGDLLNKRKFTREEIKPYRRKELYRKFLELIESKREKPGGKFIHFCYNSVYAQTLADLLKYSNEHSGQEHILFVESEQTIKDFSVDLGGNDHAHLFNKNSDGQYILKQISSDSVDGIFMHGLFRSWQFSIVEAIGDQKHIGWIIWGGDLYNTIKQGRTHLFPSDKLSSIHTIIEGDIQLFKEHFGEKENFNFTYPYPGLYGDIHVAESQERTNRIIVGNSGDPSNNHLEILEKLAEMSDIEQHKIVLPVAYNFGEEYRQRLTSKIKELGLLDRVEFHTEFIAPDEYLKFVDNNDLMIMAHNRQQAMGNMLMGMYMNKPVFLKKEITLNEEVIKNPGWDFLEENDLKALAFEDLSGFDSIVDIILFYKEQQNENQQIIRKKFGLRARAELLQKNCEQIATKVRSQDEEHSRSKVKADLI